jgi:hypothetical protein
VILIWSTWPLCCSTIFIINYCSCINCFSRHNQKQCLLFITKLLQVFAWIARYYIYVPFTVCQPRKTNFHFPFAANKWKLPFSVSFFYIYIEMVAFIHTHTHTHIYIYIYICNYIYLYSFIYLYAISDRKLKTKVCRFSVCLRRNKNKLSVCRWTKRTCASMYIGIQ